MPIKRTCQVCGETFQAKPSLIGRNRAKFCSAACRSIGHRVPLEVRFWDRVLKSEDCWLWQGGRNSNGYGIIWADGQNQQASHVAWLLTCGPIPDRLWVLHRCDNPPCVRPAHLFLGTNIDNVADMVAKGRNTHYGKPGPNPKVQGSRHGSAKLTEAEVRAARELYDTGASSVAALARQYGVLPSTMSVIVHRKTWTHV